jgi:hypothetical protein
MKRFLMVVLLIVIAAVMATGCAAKIGGTSIKPETENSAEVIRKTLAENKTIYYKIVYCEAGLLNWAIVKDPMANPDSLTVEVGEIFAKKVEELFKTKGFILKKVSNLSSTLSGVKIEMRVSAMKTLVNPRLNHIGSRWFVFNHDNRLEIYDYQIRSVFHDYVSINNLVNNLAPRMVIALLGQ